MSNVVEMKYIIVGDCFPIVFHAGLEHAKVAENLPFKPTSAGFLKFYKGELCVLGYSQSLDLKPAEDDIVILTKFFEGSYCGA